MIGWTDIEPHADALLDRFCEATEEGQRVLPRGYVYSCHGPGGGPGFNSGVLTRHVDTHSTFEALLTSIIQTTLITKCPHTVAAGFAVIMPAELAEEVLGVNFRDFVDRGLWVWELWDEGAEFVGVVHVEHIHDGFRTWVIQLEDFSPVGDWVLLHPTWRSRLPSFLIGLVQHGGEA